MTGTMQRKPAADDTSVAMTTVPGWRENGEGGERKGDEVEVESSGLSLRRSLGLLGGSSMIIGVVIGVLANSGSVGVSIIVWILSGGIALFGALCYAELGTMMGKSGAEYQYLREAYGNVLAFLYAWIGTLVLRPTSSAIILLTFAKYTAAMFQVCGAPQIPVKLTAAIALVTLGLVNCHSATLAARVQIVFTLAKLGALVVIIVGGIVKLSQGNTGVLETAFEGTVQDPFTVSFAFYSALWAYAGNLPKANILAALVVTVVYTLTNLSYFVVMSPAQLLASPAVAVTWGDQVLGVASLLIPLSVMISTFGCANGGAFAGGRLLYVAGRHGNLPDVLSYVHCFNYTPVPSLVFSIIMALIMIIPGDVPTLINFLSFTEWTFNGLTFLALFIFRFRTKWKDAARPYKVPLVIPGVMMVVSVYLVVAPIVADPRIEFLYAVLLLLSGLVFYVPFIHFKLKFKFYDHVATFVQLLMQVVPSKRGVMLLLSLNVISN